MPAMVLYNFTIQNLINHTKLSKRWLVQLESMSTKKDSLSISFKNTDQANYA